MDPIYKPKQNSTKSMDPATSCSFIAEERTNTWAKSTERTMVQFTDSPKSERSDGPHHENPDLAVLNRTRSNQWVDGLFHGFFLGETNPSY